MEEEEEEEEPSDKAEEEIDYLAYYKSQSINYTPPLSKRLHQYLLY